MGLAPPRGFKVTDGETEAAISAWKFEKNEVGEKPELTEKPEGYFTGGANFKYVKEEIGEKPVLQME
jgi:hypothetical protein